MKLTYKTLLSIVILGALFSFVTSKIKNSKIHEKKQVVLEQVNLIDKKTNSANLIAPKVYIVNPPQNYLGVGQNKGSRK